MFIISTPHHPIYPLLYNQICYGLSIQYLFIYFLSDKTIVNILNHLFSIQLFPELPFIHQPITHYLYSPPSINSPFITTLSFFIFLLPFKIIEIISYKKIIYHLLHFFQIEQLLICIATILPFIFETSTTPFTTQLPLSPFHVLSNLHYSFFCGINTYLIFITQGYKNAILFQYIIHLFSITGFCHIIYIYWGFQHLSNIYHLSFVSLVFLLNIVVVG